MDPHQLHESFWCWHVLHTVNDWKSFKWLGAWNDYDTRCKLYGWNQPSQTEGKAHRSLDSIFRIFWFAYNLPSGIFNSCKLSWESDFYPWSSHWSFSSTQEDFRLVSKIAALMTMITLIILLFIPESPVYLVSIDEIDKARKVLALLRNLCKYFENWRPTWSTKLTLSISIFHRHQRCENRSWNRHVETKAKSHVK